MPRIYANESSRWTRYCTSLMATLTRPKGSTPRQRGRRTKHFFDWMAHSTNLAKGETLNRRYDRSLCSFCGQPETQSHINTTCSHPSLVEARQMVKRKVEEFFMSYRHRHLPRNHRWIAPLIDYMEEHLWTNTVRASDIWNGRWTRDDLNSLILDASTVQIFSHSHSPEGLENFIRSKTCGASGYRSKREIHHGHFFTEETPPHENAHPLCSLEPRLSPPFGAGYTNDSTEAKAKET